MNENYPPKSEVKRVKRNEMQEKRSLSALKWVKWRSRLTTNIFDGHFFFHFRCVAVKFAESATNYDCVAHELYSTINKQ